MQRKLVLTAVGAFGWGALVGWAITADIQENRMKRERAGYDELLEDKTKHIWALQDRCERLYAASQNGSDELSPASPEEVDPNQTTISDVEPDEPETSEDDEEENVVPEGETPEETRTNLQRIIDTYAANPEAKEEFANSVDVDNDNAPPFVISRGAYAWDEEGESYDKITLNYFPRDRVLLDDDDDPIEDVQRTVGWRNLSQFGGESEDPDVVFIRNRKLMTDFEIVKDDEGKLPLHVTYGMGREEFRANRAAGILKIPQEDDDN